MTVNYKSYPPPPIDRLQILRYAGVKGASDADTEALLDAVIAEAEGELKYSLCYAELPLEICGGVCDFGVFSVRSENLATCLKGRKTAVLFAATVGVGIDRLIAKYSRISPSRALLLDAFGSERIEALCDTFCEELAGLHNVSISPRFSPGYGDLPLETQVDIMSLLTPQKHIGLTLSDSLLLTPTKSVTAFLGT